MMWPLSACSIIAVAIFFERLFSLRRDKIIPPALVHEAERLTRGVANEREITTGLESIDRVEVLSGLEPGESVVSKGFETLRDKSRVKVLR